MSRPGPSNNPPISFKTVPGRNRTQKWQQAKTVDYGGDEWGGYDVYDDYGDSRPSYQHPAPQQQYPAQRQPQPYARPAPSPSPHRLPRTNSFDQGDERQAFVATNRRPSHDRSFDPRNVSQSSGGHRRPSSRSRSRPRDFTNPEHMPPPLHTRASPALQGSGERFPPRKSSRGSLQSEAAPMEEQRSISPATSSVAAPSPKDKPLPFIRPSDIYKRIPEERVRMSEESSRPSLDLLQRERETAASPSIANSARLGLDPITESRESRLFLDDPHLKTMAGEQHSGGDAGQKQLKPPSSTLSDQLPLVRGISDLDTSFISVPSTGMKPAENGSQSNPEVHTSSQPGQSTESPAQRPPAAIIRSDEVSHTSSLQTVPVTFLPPADSNSTSARSRSSSASNERQTVSDLQHQPSKGFRSAVHQAFDHNNTEISRDNSQSISEGSFISRSGTTSTGGVSPIMSRVHVDTLSGSDRGEHEQAPTLDEATSVTSINALPVSKAPLNMQHIKRKPSPGHSRNVSGETGTPAPDFDAGSGRIVDPPASGSIPTHHPTLGDASTKRLSGPLVAESVAEPPTFAAQAAGLPLASLEPALTPYGESESNSTSSPIMIPGRPRAGTDFTVREADIANTVNASPEDDLNQPDVVAAVRSSREAFLEEHAEPVTTTITNTRAAGVAVPNSGRYSPTKGRVRDLAEKIEIASRRNSASSIGSAGSLPKFDHERFVPGHHREPSTSQQDDIFPKYGNAGPPGSIPLAAQAVSDLSSDPRPVVGRETSFRPDMPGGWISAAPTPAAESPPAIVSPTTSGGEQDIDLTPTTKKTQLQEIMPSFTPDTQSSLTSTSHDMNALEAVKNAGSELGAALLSTVGLGHQTKDFASSESPAPVLQTGMQAKPARGSMELRPPLLARWNTDDDIGAPSSVASASVPSSPAGVVTDGTLEQKPRQSGSDYFAKSEAPAPLRVTPKAVPITETDSGSSSEGFLAHQHLSSETAAEDTESDRLRKEIVRSLDSPEYGHGYSDIIKSSSIALEASPTQTSKTRTVNNGTFEKLGLLDQRFSWENKSHGQHSLLLSVDPDMRAVSPEATASPEIKPEAAYERPRNKTLGVVNAGIEGNFSLQDATTTVKLSVNDYSSEGGADASPLSDIAASRVHSSRDNLHPVETTQTLAELTPSPISDNAESVRLPSYYLSDQAADKAVDEAQPKEVTTVSAVPTTSATSVLTVPPKDGTLPSGSIPPFRNILAMRTSAERIETYKSTRRTFGEMNTGLDGWLAKMIADNPEYAELDKAQRQRPVLQTTGIGTFRRVGGHKQSPSMNIGKLANRFGAGSVPEESAGPASASSPSGGNKTVGVDMDRMQQRGKDLMKTAGVFGGKAQAGAKGLLAKGRSRFGGAGGGGGKVSSSSSFSASTPNKTFGATPALDTSGTNISSVTTDVPADLPPLHAALPSDTSTSIPAFMKEASQLGVSLKDPGTNVRFNDIVPPSSGEGKDAQPEMDFDMMASAPRPLTHTTITPTFRRPSYTDAVPQASPRPPYDSDLVEGNGCSQVDEGETRPRSKDLILQSPPPSQQSTIQGVPLITVVGGRKKQSKPRSRPVSDAIERTFSRIREFSRGGRESDVIESGDGASRNTASQGLQALSASHGHDPISAVVRNPPEAPSTSLVDDTRARSINRQPTIAPPRRAEAWNHPNAQLPRTPQAQRPEPPIERLGVLPSPAATTFEGMSPIVGRAESKEMNARCSESWLEGSKFEANGMDHCFEDISNRKPGAILALEDEATQAAAPNPANQVATTLSQEVIENSHEPALASALAALAPAPSFEDATPSFSGSSTIQQVSESRRASIPVAEKRKSDLFTLPSQRSRQASVSVSPATLMHPLLKRLHSAGAQPDHGTSHDSDDALYEAIAKASRNCVGQDCALASRVSVAGTEARPISAAISTDSRASLALDAEVSRPTTAELWSDARSDVSAAGVAYSPAEERRETNADSVLPRSPSVFDSDQSSPVRNKTSHKPSALQPEVIENPQAFPAEVASVPNDVNSETLVTRSITPQSMRSSQLQRETYRPTYRPSGPVTGEHPMSYAPQGRKHAGISTIKNANTSHPEVPLQYENSSSHANFSGISDPPAAALLSQQHLVAGGSSTGMQQSEYAKLRSSPSMASQGIIASPIEGSRRRRFSGFFRDRAQTTSPEVLVAASIITDQHGLEDLENARMSPEPRVSQQAFRSASSPIVHSAPGVKVPTAPKNEEVSRPRTLKKVQRSQSSVLPPSVSVEVTTKRRLSGLGSLFARSGTNGHSNPIKTNRLTKRDSNQRRTQLSADDHLSSKPISNSTTEGSFGDYDAYEAKMQRHDMPAFKKAPPLDRLASQPGAYDPPFQGHRGSDSSTTFPVDEYSPAPSSKSTRPQPPNFRRMHSGGRQFPFDDAREAFVPHHAPNNRLAGLSSSPYERLPNREPTLPMLPLQELQQREDVQSRQIPFDAGFVSMPISRDFSSQQGDHPEQHKPVSHLWPNQESSGPFGEHASPPQRDENTKSGSSFDDSKVAINPAREGFNHRRSWTATPSKTGSRSSTKSQNLTLWARQPERKILTEESNLPPGESSHSSVYPPTPQSQQVPSYEPYANYSTRRTPSFQQPHTLPSPQNRITYQQQYEHHSAYHVPSQSPNRGNLLQQQEQQQRFHRPPYWQGKRQSLPVRQVSDGPYALPPYNHRRASSEGYSGRRDEPALGEEAVYMRGASYPGHGWEPATGPETWGKDYD